MPAIAERPRLLPGLPVLHRGPDELQVGLGPEIGLVLSGVPVVVSELLALADGHHRRSDILAAASRYGVEPALIDRILRSLSSAGLLTDAAEEQTPAAIDLSAQRIRLVGAGRLGRAVAGALLEARVGALYLVDPDPVDLAVYPRPGLAATQALALRAELEARMSQDGDRGLPVGPGPQIRVLRHWTKPEYAGPDLTVIAIDRAEPDRAIGEDYTRADHPHLYVRPVLDGVVLGPFVEPGRGPCLRCTDLTRRDADPAWPLLLAQLCRTTLPISPLLAIWAGTTAVTQLIGRLSGHRSSVGSGTLEITAPGCELRYRTWPMHPGCGCAWYA